MKRARFSEKDKIMKTKKEYNKELENDYSTLDLDLEHFKSSKDLFEEAEELNQTLSFSIALRPTNS